MARQVLPFVGAAIGFIASGGNPMGAYWGFMAGTTTGDSIDPTGESDEHLERVGERDEGAGRR